ncbi:hypothetical protein AVEN_132644-1 [Araneus ventricosus]|uniref:Uncharacterized protein n=1 Tax=Araneus ventricosus TaxID=182803 RepID=A0A4Y2AX39_ARAVE|nr:hypothetical protein AVEN_132644-1 [Araneus ventricosus]
MLLNVPKHLRKQHSHLTSFFRLFTQDEFALTLLHNEVPNFYTLNNGNKTWQRRKQGQVVLAEAELPLRACDGLANIEAHLGKRRKTICLLFFLLVPIKHEQPSHCPHCSQSAKFQTPFEVVGNWKLVEQMMSSEDVGPHLGSLVAILGSLKYMRHLILSDCATYVRKDNLK